MAGALEGIRVLDCTQIIAGPMGASLLAEMAELGFDESTIARLRDCRAIG